DVFRGIFPDNEARAQAANLTFERAYEGALERSGLTPTPGVLEVIDKLRGSDIKIALLTGFSRATLGRVLGLLGWHDKVDLAISPEDAGGRGRPWPDMILHAVLRLGIPDVRQVAVAGDTEADMLSGRRAGAGHSRERLIQGGATHILPTIAELPELILSEDLGSARVEASAR